MNLFIVSLDLVLIGIGATLLIDLWVFFLNKIFKVPALNYGLIGRWILTFLHTGQFKHSNIQLAPQQSAETWLGWLLHYLIGIVFVFVFILMVGQTWLQQPILISATLFGIITVLFPFLIMQPCFGLGMFARKTQHPLRAQMKSLTVHTLFGIGIWLSAKILLSV